MKSAYTSACHSSAKPFFTANFIHLNEFSLGSVWNTELELELEFYGIELEL